MNLPKKDYAKLTRTGPTARAKRIYLSGVEGVGKTKFGTQCPDPYILCSEDGLTEPEYADVKSYSPEDWSDVFGVINYLTVEDHPYLSLVIDTLDWLERHAITYICQRDNQPNIEGYGYGKGPGVILPNEFRLLLSKLELLQQKKNMLIVFTSHIMVKTFNNPAGENYDRFESAGTKQVTSIVKQWCDVCLFARYDVATYKENPQAKKAKGIGGNKRIVQTNYDAAWDAKNRCGLPDVLPLDAKTILEAIYKGVPDSPENIYAEAKDLAERYLKDEEGNNGQKVKSNTLTYLEKHKSNASVLTIALNKLKHIASQADQTEPEPATV